MLVKYGVLSKIDTSSTEKRVIDQNVDIPNLITLYNVVQCKTDALSTKNDYFLHPELFKITLIRSKHTIKYAHYYLLLEKYMKHYNDFQIMQLKHKLKSVCCDRVLKLADDDKKECFVLIRNHEHPKHPYSVIRGQIKNLNKTLTKLKKSNKDILMSISCCYANNLYNKIKEKMKCIIFQKKYLFMDDEGKVLEWSYDEDMMDDYNQVSITRNIDLNIQLEDFIKKCNEINEERFDI